MRQPVAITVALESNKHVEEKPVLGVWYVLIVAVCCVGGGEGGGRGRGGCAGVYKTTTNPGLVL